MKFSDYLSLTGSLIDIGQAIKQPLEQALKDDGHIDGEEVLDITLEAIPVIAAKVGQFAAKKQGHADGDEVYFALAIALAKLGTELKTRVMEAIGDDGKLSAAEITDIAMALGPALLESMEHLVRDTEAKGPVSISKVGR